MAVFPKTASEYDLSILPIWEGKVQNRIKPNGVKAFFMKEIAESGCDQTHGECLFTYQSIGVA